MDLILRAVRNKLTEDSILTGMVSENNIRTGYNSESANYPCILLGISSDASEIQTVGITRASLIVDVYSDGGKKQLWNIYNRIKALLDNNGLGISDSYRKIHSIYEESVDENKFDKTHRILRLTAKYNVIYSILGLSVTIGANGVLYADSEFVCSDPSKEVAKFRGKVSLDISFDYELRNSQERFSKAIYYKSGTAKLTIEEVMFKPSILNLLWNIENNPEGKLNDSLTSATTYQLNQNSYPAYLQVLFQMIKTDDGKKLEIEASKAVCNNLIIPFSKNDFSVFNCEWLLLGDNNDNVVRISIEN
jgi:hypothetical protein